MLQALRKHSVSLAEQSVRTTVSFRLFSASGKVKEEKEESYFPAYEPAPVLQSVKEDSRQKGKSSFWYRAYHIKGSPWKLNRVAELVGCLFFSFLSFMFFSSLSLLPFVSPLIRFEDFPLRKLWLNLSFLLAI